MFKEVDESDTLQASSFASINVVCPAETKEDTDGGMGRQSPGHRE